MQNRKRRGFLAGVGAAVTAVVFALGGTVAANATPNIPSVPDPDTRGTLNIYKFEQPASLGTAGDGMPEDTTGLKPLGGVQFTIKKVPGVDLSTNAGWQTAGTMTVDQAKAAVVSVTGISETTGPGMGLAQFTDLPIGLYYVEETVWPSGATPSAPFLVTVPITNARPVIGTGSEATPEFPAGTTWLYQVNVYPKNAITGGQKTVSDASAVKLGDVVSWSIAADIPKADPIDAYRIVDALDSRLALITTAGADAPKLSLTGSTGVTLTEGTSDPTGDYYWTNTANGLQVDFTAAGLAKLVTAWKADATAQVEIDFKTTMLSLTDVANAGVITNQATIFPNQAAIDWEEGDPGKPPTTTEATTKWGNIVLHKVDQENTNLAGAEFQVFLSEADALAKTNPIAITKKADGSATDPAPKSIFVSDTNGLVLIDGLRYSNWADGVEQTPFNDASDTATCADKVAGGENCVANAKFRYYWVVETKAPSGYSLLADPVRVEVNSPATDVSAATKIVNVEKNAGFELPLTGGTGTLLLTILGVGILGAVLVVARRRNANADAE
ncbi:MAG: SpaH/EbpB family LPXTG-anchored major pilin [Scrofimicrobium sp.]